MNIAIKPSESVTIIGMKGSGKTQALLYLLRRLHPKGRHKGVILDTKQSGDFAGLPTTRYLKQIHLLAEKYPIFVYAPNDEEARDPDYHEAFFRWCYKRRDTTVIVDELTSIVYGNNTPPSYRDITDRGRQLNVSIWQGNQKPVFVPHAALSEADHFLVFDLLMENDRRKVATVIGNAALHRPPDPHGFLYYHRHLRTPVYVPGLQLD